MGRLQAAHGWRILAVFAPLSHKWFSLIAVQLERLSFSSSTNYFVFLRLCSYWLTLLWLLKQETVFSQHDPWLLPHYARVRNCQANNLGLHLSGRTRYSFIFELINTECCKVICKLSAVKKKNISGAAAVCRKAVFIRNITARLLWTIFPIEVTF